MAETCDYCDKDARVELRKIQPPGREGRRSTRWILCLGCLVADVDDIADLIEEE